MATRIRLRRVGRKGQAYFRIVVADSKSPRDGRFVAAIGNYNPKANPAVIEVNAEQARAWLEKGAMPTDTVRSLLKKAGVLGKSAAPATPAAKSGGCASRTASTGRSRYSPSWRNRGRCSCRKHDSTFWTKIAR